MLSSHRPERTARGRRLRLATTAVAAATVTATVTSGAARADTTDDVRTIEGQLADGAAYLIEVPPNWDGTLALYSHGLRFPGDPNPVEITPSDGSHEALLERGVALAASSFASTGWALPEAIDDQLATLEVFRTEVGTPTRTIAWGESLGGMITVALAEQHPDEIDAALPTCGPLAGAPALWNSYLDVAFTLSTLLPHQDSLRLVNIHDPVGNVKSAIAMLTAAEKTPEGRARIALAAAMAQVPGRIDPFEAPGTPSDVASRTAARISWIHENMVFFAFGERAEMEQRAGGNPSWNSGVDYAHLLDLSTQTPDVQAAYRAAGLDLDSDLESLKTATRISAEPDATAYLEASSTFTGDVDIPVLTMHTVADGLIPSSHENAYGTQVREQGNTALVRGLFVDRAGHCTFTSAELVTAFDLLVDRLETGQWTGLRPDKLNAAATALGPELSMVIGVLVPPAFALHRPLPFPRATSTELLPAA